MLLNQSESNRQHLTRSITTYNVVAGFITLLLIFSLNSLNAQAQGSSNEDLIALTGATVIDGTGAQPQENATILIKGSEIICVGTCEIPSTAEVKDADGKFIMPGLVDLHVHYGLSGWIDSIPGIFGIDVSDKYPYEDVYENLKTNPERLMK